MHKPQHWDGINTGDVWVKYWGECSQMNSINALIKDRTFGETLSSSNSSLKSTGCVGFV